MNNFFKKKLRPAIFAMAATTIAITAGACFKEIEQNPDDPGNPGTGGGISGNNIYSGLVAYYSFDDGTGCDATSNQVDGILLNGVTTIPGIRGTAVMLNAFQNQYFNIPYNLFAGLEKFSVSLWIMDFGPGCIFAAQNSNTTNSYYDEPYFSANQNGKFSITGGNNYSNTGIQFSYNYQNQGIQSGNWHHIVVSLNSSIAKLYIDGSLVDQTSINYHVANNNNCSKVVFGGDKEGSYDIKSSMKLDEIRIYNRELTANEVKKLYNLNY